MPLRLIVTRASESASPAEYFYDQDRVLIGRDTRADLRLPDVQRVVSKEHAEIRCSDTGIALVDLGSKNFTYLNDGRLDSGEPYPVRHGDRLKIGEFDILVEVVTPQFDADADRTVFDPQFINPFVDDAHELAMLLQRMRAHFDAQPPRRREDALREALEETLSEAGPHEVHDAVFARLGFVPAESPSERRAWMPGGDSGPRRSPAHPIELKPDDEPLLDVLMQCVARVVNIPWQFRHEFVGQTIVQSADNAAFLSGDAGDMRRYLESAPSETERRERMQALLDAADDLARHQLALLDGYRATVRAGAEAMLAEFHPEETRREVLAEQSVLKLFPPLAASAAVTRLQKKWEELSQEDWAAAERRTFRPAFIKAYLARMTSGRR